MWVGVEWTFAEIALRGVVMVMAVVAVGAFTSYTAKGLLLLLLLLLVRLESACRGDDGVTGPARQGGVMVGTEALLALLRGEEHALTLVGVKEASSMVGGLSTKMLVWVWVWVWAGRLRRAGVRRRLGCVKRMGVTAGVTAGVMVAGEGTSALTAVVWLVLATAVLVVLVVVVVVVGTTCGEAA